MSVCDSNCRDCVFRTRIWTWLVCNYLMVMGRRRDCPAGKGCLRKVPGPKRESLEARLYQMPPNPERKKAPAGGTGDPSSVSCADSFPQGKPGDGETAAAIATTRKKEKTAEEIAEKKRKKAAQHRAWVTRNREHLREYQREYRRKKAGE